MSIHGASVDGLIIDVPYGSINVESDRPTFVLSYAKSMIVPYLFTVTYIWFLG